MRGFPGRLIRYYTRLRMRRRKSQTPRAKSVSHMAVIDYTLSSRVAVNYRFDTLAALTRS